MPLTSDEFAEIVSLICPHCRAGDEAKKGAIHDWQHVTRKNSAMTVTVCWATGLRNSEKWNPDAS